MPLNSTVALPGDTAPTLVDLRFAEAARLDQLAAETGDERFRRAAGALRGRRAGRPGLPDDDALAGMASMLKTGEAGSVTEAATMEAISVGGRAVDVDRLRRKFRKFRQLAQVRKPTGFW